MHHSPAVLPWTGTKSPINPELVTGTVIASEQTDSYLVNAGALVLSCTVAVSCLVKPIDGDRVLVCREGSSTTVLAILDRIQTSACTLQFTGDVCLEVPAGDVSIATAQNLRLTAAKGIQLASTELAITNNITRLVAKTVDVAAHHVKANAQIAGVVAERLETVANTAIQHLTRSMRLIEESDILRAGEVLQTIKRTFSLRSRHSLISAESDVRIDGERIHMG